MNTAKSSSLAYFDISLASGKGGIPYSLNGVEIPTNGLESPVYFDENKLLTGCVDYS